MLVDILPHVARLSLDFVPTDGGNRTHFAQRASEHGVACASGDRLRLAVERAVYRGRMDLVELVFRICPDSRLFRILVDGVPFYPIIANNGVAVTIYPHAYVQAMRRGRRHRQRRSGSRLSIKGRGVRAGRVKGACK